MKKARLTKAKRAIGDPGESTIGRRYARKSTGLVVSEIVGNPPADSVHY